MALTIERVNPLQYEAQLKQLFLAHDRPEYPGFFDRAYPAAVREGAASWVGFDATGRLVTHLALFPQRFSLGDRVVRAVLLVNMMVAREHRKLLPAVALVKRALSDSRESGAVDFVYADPNQAATPVITMCGFTRAAVLRRFALPIGGATALEALAGRMYAELHRLGAGNDTLAVERHGAASFDGAACEHPPGRSGCLRPVHPTSLYAIRMQGYPAPTDHWFTFHPQGGDTARVVAAALVRGPEEPRVFRVCSLWRPPEVPLGAMTRPLTRELRDMGCSRIQMWTLVGSPLAREMRRVGFLPRAERHQVLALPLTPLGEEAVRAAPRWEITDLDCDR